MIKAIISGMEYTPQSEGFEIEDRIEERTVARFFIDDPAGELSFRKGQPVRIEEDGNTEFAGVINSSKYKVLDNQQYRRHSVVCIDYHYATDKRLAARAYENEKAGDIVKDLHGQYLEEEGIYIGTPWTVYEGMTWNEVIE